MIGGHQTLSRTEAFGCAALLGWVVLTGFLAWKCVATAIGLHKGWLAAVFLVFVGVAVLTTALVKLEEWPTISVSWRSWLNPKPIAGFYVATFASFGTMMAVLNTFSPSPAVETRPGTLDRIEPTINAIKRDLKRAPAHKPKIEARIVGLWGEPGCNVVYSFRVAQRALRIIRVRASAGAPPFDRIATIVRENDDTLSAVTDDQIFVSFDYETNGTTEHLLWHDGMRPTLRFDRCSPS